MPIVESDLCDGDASLLHCQCEATCAAAAARKFAQMWSVMKRGVGAKCGQNDRRPRAFSEANGSNHSPIFIDDLHFHHALYFAVGRWGLFRSLARVWVARARCREKNVGLLVYGKAYLRGRHEMMRREII